MFSNLLESRAARMRRTSGSLVSIVMHAGIIGALVIVTANASQPTVDDNTPVDKLTFTKVEPPTPLPPPPAANQVYRNTPVSAGTLSLIAPIEIPNIIPDIDLSRAPTDASDFDGTKPRGMPAGAGAIASTSAPLDGVYSELQVESPVRLAPGAIGPSYPDMLRTAGIDGTVLAQFVVDTLGRADVSTFRALQSDNALFSNAVRAALGRMRFIPAQAGGRKVAQLVQQSYQFNVAR